VWLSVRMHLPADMAIVGRDREHADSPATPKALAERTGCDERYVLEWLTSHAVAGRLTVAAGYAGAQILPIEHPAWRFYRLVP